MKICVLIPTYNEAKTIHSLVSEIRRYLPDVLVIDDGSTDRTALLAEEAKAKVIYNSINQGKGATLRQGFQQILQKDYTWVLTIDGDGQHNPQEIPLFLEKAKREKVHLIIGNRLRPKERMPMIRWMTNHLMSFLISKFIGQNIPDTQCGYRLIHRRVLERISLHGNHFESESELVIRAVKMGFTVDSVPIRSIYDGQMSQIRPLRDTVRFIQLLWHLR